MILLDKDIGPVKATGNLVVGEFYKIVAYVDQDFTADGAPNNNIGTYFKATDTNVTLDANNKVQRIFPRIIREGYTSLSNRQQFSWVEVDDETGSSARRASMVDGAAFFWPVDVDLSGYINGAYRIRLHDSTGNQAIGYISQTAAAGETLGSELTTNGDNEAAVVTFDEDSNTKCTAAQDGTQTHGGSSSCLLTSTGDGDFRRNLFDTNESDTSNGALYKITAWSYCPSGQGSNRVVLLYNDGVSNFRNDKTTTDAFVQHGPYYFTPRTAFLVNLYAIGGSYLSGDIVYFDDISFKQVTDPPSTGLHIVSTAGGTTRNWASVASGFNPNAISKIQIVTP